MQSLSKNSAVVSLFNNGVLAINQGDWETAIKFLETLVAKEPKHAPGIAHLAFALSRLNRHSEAIVQLKKLLPTRQNLAQTHFNIGISYVALKNYADALAHLSHAVKANPSFIDALIERANCLRVLGDLDIAETEIVKVLNQDKRNARAFQTLGLIYADKDDMGKALECFENAIGLAPNELSFKCSFATHLAKADLHIEAEDLWRSICTEHPDYFEGFVGYGLLLREMHAYDQAIECFERAVQIKPTEVLGYEELGKTYAEMGNLEKSLACFNDALAIAPDDAFVTDQKIAVYLEHGKTYEALDLANHLIGKYPDYVNGYLALARVKKSTKEDGLSEKLARFSASKDENINATVHFVLGKIFDDQKDYSNAFKHYDLGNKLRNSKLTYEPAQTEAMVDALIGFFSEDFFKQTKHLQTLNGSDVPVFILGMPRSGTTLTEQIISSHPDVIGAGEVSFWDKLSGMVSMMLNAQEPYPFSLKNLNTEHAQFISQQYLHLLLRAAGNEQAFKHVTDKMPHNFLHLGFIHLLFPHAKIIHTKRMPIDNCLSIYFQNFSDFHYYGFNLKNLGHYYRQYERLMQHWHTVLPGKILDIQYENTTDDPEYWSRELIKYVGLEWNDACLNPHKLERSVKTASIWQVRQPIYKSSVERWRNYEPFISDLIEALK